MMHQVEWQCWQNSCLLDCETLPARKPEPRNLLVLAHFHLRNYVDLHTCRIVNMPLIVVGIPIFEHVCAAVVPPTTT